MRSGTFGHVGMWRLRTLLLGGALIQLSQGAQHGLLVVAAHHLVALRGDERASVPLTGRLSWGRAAALGGFSPHRTRGTFLRYNTQISPRVSPHDRRLRQKTVCNDLTDLKYHACGHEHPCGITERFSQASNSTPLLRTTPWLLSIGVFARPSAPPRGRHRSHRKDCPFSSSDRESLIRCAR